MNFGVAERIADAVLYEGYVLYPYRASAAKNRLRWQVGLVTPRSYAEATRSDPWFTQTECLVDADAAAAITVKVRFLQVQQRIIEAAIDADSNRWRPVDTLVVDGTRLITWEEGVARDFVRHALPLAGPPREWRFPLELAQGHDVETVREASGRIVARVVRRRKPVSAAVLVGREPCDGLTKVRVRIENLTACPALTLADRDVAILHSLAGTHALLAIENGAFVSLLEPPSRAAAAAATCTNLHAWPVLVGSPGSRSMMLSSPIILYDYPTVAPESPGDLCDATEIDELLMLRVKTMTDAEKAEARATDERAARIVDSADSASAATLGRLHGAVRHYAETPGPPVWETFVNPPDDASPEAAFVEVGTTRVGRGCRVRLRPTHRADSMDICLDGRLATVTAVYRTLEDQPYVSVALDDDPFGTAGSRYRRSLFFHPDELVPLHLDASAAEAASGQGP